MNDSKRKPNRLYAYDYSQNGAYFITICTQDRKKILSSIVGDGSSVPKPYGIIAEEMIAQISVKYPSVTVDKHVIMPDHIHLLLRFDRNLGNVIGWFKYQVTKQVDAQFNLNGAKLFQRSYYDHVIRNQQDYGEIWQYIENNPRKWIIEKRGYE